MLYTFEYCGYIYVFPHFLFILYMIKHIFCIKCQINVFVHCNESNVLSVVIDNMPKMLLIKLNLFCVSLQHSSVRNTHTEHTQQYICQT